EYAQNLQQQTGWQKRAWYDGSWDINAGQFFTTFRWDTHVLNEFDERRATQWIGGFDYGFNHYTVALLACIDTDGNLIIVDEHCGRLALPVYHVGEIKQMLQRHKL